MDRLAGTTTSSSRQQTRPTVDGPTSHQVNHHFSPALIEAVLYTLREFSLWDRDSKITSTHQLCDGQHIATVISFLVDKFPRLADKEEGHRQVTIAEWFESQDICHKQFVLNSLTNRDGLNIIRLSVLLIHQFITANPEDGLISGRIKQCDPEKLKLVSSQYETIRLEVTKPSQATYIPSHSFCTEVTSNPVPQKSPFNSDITTQGLQSGLPRMPPPGRGPGGTRGRGGHVSVLSHQSASTRLRAHIPIQRIYNTTTVAPHNIGHQPQFATSSQPPYTNPANVRPHHPLSRPVSEISKEPPVNQIQTIVNGHQHSQEAQYLPSPATIHLTPPPPPPLRLPSSLPPQPQQPPTPLPPRPQQPIPSPCPRPQQPAPSLSSRPQQTPSCPPPPPSTNSNTSYNIQPPSSLKIPSLSSITGPLLEKLTSKEYFRSLLSQAQGSSLSDASLNSSNPSSGVNHTGKKFASVSPIQNLHNVTAPTLARNPLLPTPLTSTPIAHSSTQSAPTSNRTDESVDNLNAEDMDVEDDCRIVDVTGPPPPCITLDNEDLQSNRHAQTRQAALKPSIPDEPIRSISAERRHESRDRRANRHNSRSSRRRSRSRTRSRSRSRTPTLRRRHRSRSRSRSLSRSTTSRSRASSRSRATTRSRSRSPRIGSKRKRRGSSDSPDSRYSKNRIASLKDENDKLRDELRDYRRRVDRKNEEIENLNADLRKKRRYDERLKEEKRKSLDREIILKKKLDEREAEVKKLRIEAAKHKVTYSQSCQTPTKSTATAENQTEPCSELEGYKLEAERELWRLAEQNESLEKDKQHLNSQIEDLKQTVIQLKLENEKLVRDKDATLKAEQNHHLEIASYKEGNHQLKVDVEHLSRENQVFQSVLESLKTVPIPVDGNQPQTGTRVSPRKRGTPKETAKAIESLGLVKEFVDRYQASTREQITYHKEQHRKQMEQKDRDLAKKLQQRDEEHAKEIEDLNKKMDATIKRMQERIDAFERDDALLIHGIVAKAHYELQMKEQARNAAPTRADAKSEPKASSSQNAEGMPPPSNQLPDKKAQKTAPPSTIPLIGSSKGSPSSQGSENAFDQSTSDNVSYTSSISPSVPDAPQLTNQSANQNLAQQDQNLDQTLTSDNVEKILTTCKGASDGNEDFSVGSDQPPTDPVLEQFVDGFVDHMTAESLNVSSSGRRKPRKPTTRNSTSSKKGRGRGRPSLQQKTVNEPPDAAARSNSL